MNSKLIKFLVIFVLISFAAVVLAFSLTLDKREVITELTRAVVSGTFTSALAVLIIEVRNYIVQKDTTRYLLLAYLKDLYGKLFLLQDLVGKTHGVHVKNITESIFDNSISMCSNDLYLLRNTQYTPLTKDAFLSLVSKVKNNIIPKTEDILWQFTYFKLTVIGEKLACLKTEESTENNKHNDVLDILYSQLGDILDELDKAIETMDKPMNVMVDWDYQKNIIRKATKTRALNEDEFIKSNKPIK